jgi:hypothetical protein
VYEIMLSLHVLFAIFALGPLVHAATTASRGVRQGDAVATAGAGRMLRMYSVASVLVVLVGFGLMSAEAPWSGEAVASFSDTWIWLSALLWLVAIGLVLGLLVPALEKATATIKDGQPAASLTGRIAATGGAVAIIIAVIVFLMVYQPGS